MQRRSWLLAFLCSSWLAIASAAGTTAPPTWLLIDVAEHQLSVLQGDKVVDKIDYVALGRGGTTTRHLRGDNATPLGEFHIAWINWSSPFHIFFGLDFPTLQEADAAYRDKRIDRDTYYQILDAVRDGRLPPQNTALGGRIGIHGLGRGSLRIHKQFNWTKGCIAMTNREIERLARWVRIGTRVVIR